MKLRLLNRNKFLGFVFQSFNLINYKTALENVSLPLYYQASLKGKTRTSTRLPRTVGLKEWSSFTFWWSKTRVAIARAMASKQCY